MARFVALAKTPIFVYLLEFATWRQIVVVSETPVIPSSLITTLARNDLKRYVSEIMSRNTSRFLNVVAIVTFALSVKIATPALGIKIARSSVRKLLALKHIGAATVRFEQILKIEIVALVSPSFEDKISAMACFTAIGIKVKVAKLRPKKIVEKISDTPLLR